MRKRTDLAAPTVIDPATFTFIAGVYYGHAGEDMDEMLGDWMSEKAGDDPHWDSRKRHELMKSPDLLNLEGNFARKGTCDHCGAAFKWGSIYRHTSGKLIVVGNICADNTLSVPTRRDLDVKRLKARMQAHATMIRNTVLACENAIAGGYVWLYAEEHTNPTLADIAHKGLQWGGLTDRQVELINKIRYGVKPQWQLDKEQREAARIAEEAAALPVPDTNERIHVKGVVLTTREQAGYMPGTSVTKMLVKTDAGYKLWGACPNFKDIKIGSHVEFYARIERSNKDPKFGYYSRPTKWALTVKNVTQ